MPQQRSRTIVLITAVIVLVLTIVVILLAQKGATQGALERGGQPAGAVGFVAETSPDPRPG